MRVTAFYALALLILTSCGTQPISKRSSSLNKIDSLETVFFDDSKEKSDQGTGMALVRAYAKFYQDNKEDSLAVDMLFKAGEVSMGILQGNLAVKYFDLIAEDHNNFYKAPEALFLAGFCSENINSDTTNARIYYERFIAQYPEHHLVEDAQFSIENMGMSDNELIELFEQNLNSEQES